MMTKSRVRRDKARALLASITARSRETRFFAGLHVPDTLDGRFDLLTLHAFLVLERLRDNRDLSQSLTDAIFLSLDESLRELGAGDMGMGRKMKSMANAFYGRLEAYAHAQDETALAAAIKRNVFRGRDGSDGAARTFARYMMSARATLASADLEQGGIDFGPLPDTA